jgi:phosphoribosylanthranilate isomerase
MSALALDSAVVVGVDASSGVESAAGVKDEAKLKSFAANARSV